MDISLSQLEEGEVWRCSKRGSKILEFGSSGDVKFYDPMMNDYFIAQENAIRLPIWAKDWFDEPEAYAGDPLFFEIFKVAFESVFTGSGRESDYVWTKVTKN